nr:MAG TPA: hypothetical protein [Caudoviricetes sp.]
MSSKKIQYIVISFQIKVTMSCNIFLDYEIFLL